jgi:hypothetical protein
MNTKKIALLGLLILASNLLLAQKMDALRGWFGYFLLSIPVAFVLAIISLIAIFYKYSRVKSAILILTTLYLFLAFLLYQFSFR